MNTHETKKLIRKAWHRILDSSETLDHLESIVSVKVRRWKESRKVA